jgi:hypothetical protein
MTGRSQEGRPEKEPLPVVLVHEPLGEMHVLLDRVSYWGERADLKATILMGAVTAALAAEAIGLGEFAGRVGQQSAARSIPPLALLLVGFASTLLAGVFAGLSFYPRLGRGEEPVGELEPGDLTYFGRLRWMSPQAMRNALEGEIARGTLIDHYAEQIASNAGIAWQKHRYLQRSLRFLAVSGVAALTATIVWTSTLAGVTR